jgi:hypothetical protein
VLVKIEWYAKPKQNDVASAKIMNAVFFIGRYAFVCTAAKMGSCAVLLLLTKVNRITGASMMNLENVIFLFPGDLMES